MKDCKLCDKCKELLSYWHIPYDTMYDYPKLNRPYPYLEFICEYEELVELIAKRFFDKVKK